MRCRQLHLWVWSLGREQGWSHQSTAMRQSKVTSEARAVREKVQGPHARPCSMAGKKRRVQQRRGTRSCQRSGKKTISRWCHGSQKDLPCGRGTVSRADAAGGPSDERMETSLEISRTRSQNGGGGSLLLSGPSVQGRLLPWAVVGTKWPGQPPTQKKTRE